MLLYGGEPPPHKATLAGSHVVIATSAGDERYYLNAGFVLDPTPGMELRGVHAPVTTDVGCPARPFEPLGTWSAHLR
jgi:hypothetical protein